MAEGQTRSEQRRGRTTGDTRRRRGLVAAVIVVFVVPLVAVGVYLGYLNHVVTTNIQHAALLPTGTAPVTLPGADGATATADPTVGADGSPIDPSEPGGDIAAGAALVPAESLGDNYLIVGSDARPGLAGGRSDVIILVHVPVDHHNVTLIHFPRDMYVPIPGRGRNKINAAFAFGGVPLLVQTLQNMLGVKIDHAVLFGFEGFKRTIDAVGGVDVTVEEGGTIDGYVFTKGQMHLDGAAALAFVRERYDLSRGDLSRGRRQQAVVKSLLLHAVSAETLANPVRLAQLVDAATANATVDNALDVGTMRGELFALRGLRASDVRMITAPITGFGTGPGGASIDVVDWGRIASLGTAIREDHVDSYAG